MAVLPMNRFNLCAMRRDRKKIMESLQRLGKVELCSSSAPDEVFSCADMLSETKNLEEQLQLVKGSLAVLKEHAFEKQPALAFLNGATYRSVEDYDDLYNEIPRITKEASDICKLDGELTKLAVEKIKSDALKTQLSPWKDLSVPLSYSGSKSTICFIGTLPEEFNTKDLLLQLAELLPATDNYHIEIISSSKEQTCIYLVGLKKDHQLLKDALDQLGFSLPIKTSPEVPALVLERLDKQEKINKARAEEAKEEIVDLASNREGLLFLADHLQIRIDKYKAINSLKQSKHTFLCEGYILKEDAPKLTKMLTERFDCIVSCSEPDPKDETPVQLRNNWFTEPGEKIVESFAYPTRDDIDPTSVMSIFYYVMFGLMFSDAGYGFILATACAFCLIKFRNMDRSWSLNIRLFFWCGISTLFWGIVFSSYFGDVVDVVSLHFFGKALTIPPLWFVPLKDPMRLLLFCLCIGIVHLTTGYVMNAVSAIHRKDYLAAVYDAFFPVLVLGGALPLFMGSSIFFGLSGFTLTISPLITNLCLGAIGVGCVGVLFTGGRESKNWFKRLLKGIYALYNVLAGWISDILSYSRLLALGLATGVIGSVINSLGAMTGKGIVGAIGFIVVFLFGHALNFGINILGAYVHSNRLEFVEFFGKFFDGGGRKFEPLAINTKNYKIWEELKNG